MADTYVKLKQSDAVAIRAAVQEKTGGTGTMTAPEIAEAIEAMTTVDDVTVVNCGTSSTTIADLYDSANGGSY